MELHDVLVGRTIDALEWSSDQILLKVSWGECVTLNSLAECCSESWFEHVETCEFPAKVLSLKVYEPDSVDGGPQAETLSYLYQIRTDKGVIDIEMRNSSNGYYGGSIGWFTEVKGSWR